jgi:hypothetical protein
MSRARRPAPRPYPYLSPFLAFSSHLAPVVRLGSGSRGPSAMTPLAGAFWWFKGGKDVVASFGAPPCNSAPALSILYPPSCDVPMNIGSPTHSCPGPWRLGRFFIPCILHVEDGLWLTTHLQSSLKTFPLIKPAGWAEGRAWSRCSTRRSARRFRPSRATPSASTWGRRSRLIV